MDTTQILRQLQDNISKQFTKLSTTVSQDELDEMFGPGFNPASYMDSAADDEVEDAEAVDTPYTTYRPYVLPQGSKTGSGNILPFEEAAGDQAEEDQERLNTDINTANAAEEQEPEVGAGNMGAGDIDAGDMGADMGGDMGGYMGMPQEQKTASELGRIYELKKIYTRLTSIESYLGNESSQELLEIRNYVSQSIELFEIIAANFDSFKEKLDEVIVMYYKFLIEVYGSVKNYYGQVSKKED